MERTFLQKYMFSLNKIETFITGLKFTLLDLLLVNC
jgi:hypothetical protein